MMRVQESTSVVNDEGCSWFFTFLLSRFLSLFKNNTAIQPNDDIDQDASQVSDLSSIVVISPSSPTSHALTPLPRRRYRLKSLSFKRRVKPLLPSYHSKPPNETTGVLVHSIISLFRAQELGRNILVLTVPITAAVISLHSQNPATPLVSLVLLFLSLGFAATWNGILLRDMYPRVSNVTEQVGVAFIFLAFFSTVGCFLPHSIAWVAVLSLLLSLLPFFLAVWTREKPSP